VIERVRPHQIFAMVSPDERDFTGQLPRASAGGGITTLEACLLVAVLRAVRPACIFEFGTYLGDTTRLLAQNFATSGGVVYTLDLDSTAGIELEGPDATLASRSVIAERSFNGLRAEVVQLLGDSYTLDPTPYEDRIGLVFVDGNHALRYLERDTTNALRMLSSKGPSAVIWHDYGNPDYPEVTQYLDSLSNSMRLNRIEETMLVLRLQGLALPERQST
jgi:predicted O-methyltransferase YrrM